VRIVMPIYIFFREGGGWYPVTEINDEAIMKHIPLNPGTTKVLVIDSPGAIERVVWERDKVQ